MILKELELSLDTERDRTLKAIVVLITQTLPKHSSFQKDLAILLILLMRYEVKMVNS